MSDKDKRFALVRALYDNGQRADAFRLYWRMEKPQLILAGILLVAAVYVLLR
jgi:hypothetical protein